MMRSVGLGLGLALGLASTACGGGARTLPPLDEPGAGGAGEVGGGAAAGGPEDSGTVTVTGPAKAGTPPAVRQALIGEMCPERGAGRPALALLVARQVGWSADPGELDTLAARVGARPFAVLAQSGTRAGVFDAVGPVDLGTEAPALTGGYAGKSPCEDPDAAVVAACKDAHAGCGLAVASLAPDGVDEAPPVRVGAACAVDEGKTLRVDIDGDGNPESFAIAGFLDELKAPASEVAATGAAAAKGECTPRFSLPGLVRGKDAKAFRALDLVGVVDLDEDGRFELVLQYRYAKVRTWAIYSADQTARRLALVAEVAPWAAE